MTAVSTRLMRPAYPFQQMRVSEIMTAPVRTIAVSESARKAALFMRSSAIRHLVALDTHGHVAGVVSDRDLRAAQPSVLLLRDTVQREKALALLKVQDVMTPRPHIARAGDRAESALELMRDGKYGAVPVVDSSGTLVGIVTGFDVLNLAIRLLGDSGR